MDIASLLLSLLIGQATSPARAEAPPVERPANHPELPNSSIRPLWPPIGG